MRVESDSEGLGEEKETEVPEKTQRRLLKNSIVIAVVLILLVAGLVVMFNPPRYLTIKDLIEKVVDWREPPYFDPSLAGTTVWVEGKVTNITTHETTIGFLTFIVLNDYPDLRLVEWKEPTFAVGDPIVREIRFEWGQYNNNSGVISPQIDFPVLREAYVSQFTSLVQAWFNGIYLFNRNDDLSDEVIVDVYLDKGEGFPLGLFNASLRKGVSGPPEDYYDAMFAYIDNPEIDRLDTLEDSMGENETMVFFDANSNGLLDDWDFFMLNLSRPSDINTVETYMLLINDGHEGFGVLEGECHITMTDRGTLQFFVAHHPSRTDLTGGRMRIASEVATPTGISTELQVSDIWGTPIEIQNATCSLWQEGKVLDCSALREGIVGAEGNYTVSFSDMDHDGHLTVGDLFVVSGLANLTEYTFSSWGEDYRLSPFEWTTGIGAFTGHLPVILWEEPLALDSPINRTFKLQIEQMYGIPKVALGDFEERMVVDIKRNGSPVLILANLTQDFNFTSAELNVTFEDADANGYANTGDYFVCVSFGPAELEIILSYVNTENYRTRDLPQPLISWSVSWIAG